MARTKAEMTVAELQSLISEVESEGLFNSPHKVYEKVAEKPLARDRGFTPVMVYLRVKEFNGDPSNPQIVMRTKPARVVGQRQPRGTSTAAPKRATKVSINGWDTLMEAFKNRGVDVQDVSDLMTSAHKSREVNKAVLLAWANLRDLVGCPKPLKVAAGVAQEGVVGGGEGSGVEVIEEMPAGGPVAPVAAPVALNPPVIAAVVPPAKVGPGVAVPVVVKPTVPVAPQVTTKVSSPVQSVKPAVSAPAPVQPAVSAKVEAPVQVTAVSPAKPLLSPVGVATPISSYKSTCKLQCNTCDFSTTDIDEADQHEAHNVGHSVNV